MDTGVIESRSALCDFVNDYVQNVTQHADPNQLPAFDWLRQKFSESLSKCYIPADVMNKQAEEWLNWAHLHKNLKVISVPIPTGILPDGMTGQLHDVRVNCRGPDDAIFDRDEEIRNKVARGNCFLEISQQDPVVASISSKSFCIIRALKKFTGGLGDDDDDESGNPNAWKIYFTQPLEAAQSIVCTSKINGEAGHLGVCRIGSDFYICAGSKNVHLLFRDRADLERYNLADQRYAIAQEVCYCLLSALESMPELTRTSLFQFLCITRSTAVFEMLSPSHPHVEDLSYLDQNQLKFITWTSCDLQSTAKPPPSVSPPSLCCMPPDAAVELARIFGFDAVKYSLITPADVERRMSDIRQCHGLEGEVLFFLDTNRSTIGMLKKKSVWYIVVRAIREKMRVACGLHSKDPRAFSLSNHESKIDKRLTEIQKWLSLDDSTTAAWQALGHKCLHWCIQKMESGTLDGIGSRFPVYWKAFLAETGETDVIPFVPVVSL